MNLIHRVFVVVLLLLTGSASAKVVSIAGEDGFSLKADFHKGSTEKPSVLLLHQCNRTRQMYKPLVEQLNNRGFTTLALDFRMFGDSVDEQQSVKYLRSTATSRENYFSRFNKIRDEHWNSDVEKAVSFLKSRSEQSSFQLVTVGASCGGDQSLTLLSQDPSVFSQVFISTPFSEASKALMVKSTSVPRFFVTGSLDPVNNTPKDMSEAYQSQTHQQARFFEYKSEIHGEGLFELDSYLAESIAQWVEKQTYSNN